MPRPASSGANDGTRGVSLDLDMIELTPVAAQKLNEIRAGDAAHAVLRVYVKGKSCCGYAYGLALDEAAAAEDTVVERDGITIAVDPQSLPFVQGATIDHIDELMGGGFTVRNDALGGSCACGRR
jgi:iron-sulfur cluster assembly accessory protein